MKVTSDSHLQSGVILRPENRKRKYDDVRNYVTFELKYLFY